MKQCTSELERAGLERDRDLIHFLNREDFMHDSEQEDILNPRSLLSKDQKAGEIVKWIRHRVQQDTSSYHKLIRQLSACEQRYQPIVKKLEECRKALEQGIVGNCVVLSGYASTPHAPFLPTRYWSKGSSNSGCIGRLCICQCIIPTIF